MKWARRASIATVFISMLMFSSSVVASCGAAPVLPKIEVRSDIRQPSVDTSLGIRAIAANPDLALPNNPGGKAYPFGVTGLGVSYEWEFEMIGEPRAEVGACWSIRNAVLTIIVKTDVHIAAEIVRDSCVWQQVIDHEMKHVRLHRDLIPQQIEAMRAEMMRVAGRSVAGMTDQDAASVFRAEMQAGLASVSQRHSENRQRQQLAIDTPYEYERVARACGNTESAAVFERAGIQ